MQTVGSDDGSEDEGGCDTEENDGAAVGRITKVAASPPDVH